MERENRRKKKNSRPNNNLKQQSQHIQWKCHQLWIFAHFKRITYEEKTLFNSFYIYLGLPYLIIKFIRFCSIRTTSKILHLCTIPCYTITRTIFFLVLFCVLVFFRSLKLNCPMQCNVLLLLLFRLFDAHHQHIFLSLNSISIGCWRNNECQKLV